MRSHLAPTRLRRVDDLRERDRAGAVEPAGALRQRVERAAAVGDRDRRELEDGLERVRRQARIDLQDERDERRSPRRPPCSCRSAAWYCSRAAARLVLPAQARCPGRDREQPVSGGRDVGLREPVVPRGPARAVGRDAIVGARRRVERLNRADRQRRRGVAGRGHARVSRQARRRVHAVVPGRGHDDQPGAHGAFDRLHERVAGGRLVDRVPERQVHDADAERVLVVDRELDGAQHVARLSLRPWRRAP